MADKAVADLIEAAQITNGDWFLLEQGGIAKKLRGQTMVAFLTALADGHGGISGIQKTGTIGLVDTYQIRFADGTAFEFTVTNGAKGDKGDNAYIWIKYASQEPTASANSMGDLPDRWMGIYVGNSATAPTNWQQYKWFEIKGQKGDTGAPATVVTNSVEYQVSAFGTDIPIGQWVDSVPETPQGFYLWSRMVTRFNTGNPVTVYSVSRSGKDGLGTLRTINGNEPDANGDLTISAASIGALSKNGDTLRGPLNAAGNTITGLPAPVNDTDAVPFSMIQNVRELKWQNPDADANFAAQTIVISDPEKRYTFATVNFLALKQSITVDQHIITLDDLALESDYNVKRRVYDGTGYREMYISYADGAWHFRFWDAKNSDAPSVSSTSSLIPVEIYMVSQLNRTTTTTTTSGDGGQRGTGLLPVTTEPSSYTTAVGGITPNYRMAISTIKSQAGVSEVLLGDTVQYSYYHYPIDYLDASYAYFTERVSIRGEPGKDGVNGVTPHVGSNGNWFIGDNDTGIPATGPAGGQGLPGAPGEDGKDGSPGKDGSDGVSATHSWNGTVLSITSASGTSSADLKGEKGDKGDKGDTGATGSAGPSGVYILGDGETLANAPDDVDVIIDPNGEATKILTEADVNALINAALSAIPNAAEVAY